MFKKFFVKPSSVQSDAKSSPSSSGSSTDHLGEKDIPSLKRRHSSVLPYSESLFLNASQKAVESDDISIDPFEHPSIRRSKSIAEGMLDRNGKGYKASTLKLSKSVRFESDDRFAERGLALFDSSFEHVISKELSQGLETGEFKQKVECFPKISSFKPSPAKSITSSSYCDISESDPRLDFLTLKEYKTFESNEQQMVTLWTEDNESVGTERPLTTNSNDSSQGCNDSSYLRKYPSRSSSIENHIISNEDMSLILEYLSPFIEYDSSTMSKNVSTFHVLVKNAAIAANGMVAKKNSRILELEEELHSLKQDYERDLDSFGNAIDQVDSKIESISNRIELVFQEESKVSLAIQAEKIKLASLSEVLECIHKHNTEKMPLNEFLQQILDNSCTLRGKEVAMSEIETEMRSKVSVLEQKLCKAQADETYKAELLNKSVLELKDEIMAKDKVIQDIQNSLIELQKVNRNLGIDLEACSQKFQSSESQLNIEMARNVSMKSTIKNLQDKENKSQVLFTELELENQSTSSSYEYELKLQTIEIKKLIKENKMFINTINERDGQIGKLKCSIQRYHAKLKNANQSNKMLKFHLIEMIQIVAIRLSDFIEQDSNNLVQDALQIITSSEDLHSTIESDKELESLSVNKVLLESVIHFVSSAIENLIEIFKQNEIMLKIELDNKAGAYHNMLEKLIDMMSERGIINSPTRRRIRTKFN
ncbi:hypothetical protein CLIB1423_02S05424 [[Candida] railenensis]|uniref:Uncharacterized protein n=1 Tax=[Candida] railenensis TaxID=45579 RepID=A0A9P0QLE7_9ASCO|nr:hypothetical protein CLIB1423_02S05424 [[Candida] railenensis]